MLGKRRKIRERIKAEYGRKRDEFVCDRDKNKIDLIRLYNQEMEECGSAGEVDDITWNDLQMDDVFATVNFTRSFIGEQSLYHRLHCANVSSSDSDNAKDTDRYKNGNEIRDEDRSERINEKVTENKSEELEKKIQVQEENEDVRIDVEERLASIGKSEDSYYYLASFLMHAELWKISNTFLIHLMQGLLLAVGLWVPLIDRIRIKFERR